MNVDTIPQRLNIYKAQPHVLVVNSGFILIIVLVSKSSFIFDCLSGVIAIAIAIAIAIVTVLLACLLRAMRVSCSF
jgi:hypothetical protein